MGTINIDDVKVGMVLADDVRDWRGKVLLRGGTEVTEKHLRIFKMWGITEANVEGVESRDMVAQAVAEVDPVLLQAAEEQVRELFRHVNLNHPASQELFYLCTLRRAQKEAAGGRYGS